MADGDGLQPPRDTASFIEAIGDKVFQRLRVESPPKSPPPAVDWIKVAPYVVALLMLCVGVLGWIANKQIDQLAKTAELSAKNAAAIERIDQDRAARIASTNVKLDKLEQRTAPIDAILKDIGRLETYSTSLDTRLVQGRDERLSDRDKMLDAINSLKTEVALLRQSMEAGRGSPPAPFGQNGMLIRPPTKDSPSILRVTYSDLASPASPPKAKHRAVARRVGKRRVARPRTFLVSLTRALERMGGKPRYRRRGWP